MGVRYLLIIIISLFVCFNAESQIISGRDSTYIGKQLEFYSYSNGITNVQKSVGKAVCDSLGAFKCQLNIDQTTEVFFRVGEYEVYFAASPNRDYKIVMPPIGVKSVKDELNPFFKYNRVYALFSIPDDYSLNNKINMFEYRFSEVYSECAFAKVARKSTNEIASVIDSLDLEFENSSDPYFEIFKESKIALLKYKFKVSGYLDNTKSILSKYPQGISNRAYSELLNTYFGDILKISSNKLTKKIKYMFWAKEPLNSLLSETKGIVKQDFLSELFLIKAIGFYSIYDDIDFEYLMKLLLDIEQSSLYKLNSEVCKQSYNSHIYLHKGYSIPDLALFKSDGENFDISKYNGKYVLIAFCTTYGTSIYNELKALKSFYGKFTRELKVVLIFKSSDKKMVHTLDEAIHERWDILYDDNKTAFENYKIKVYPTFYLVDRKGKMLLSPAPYMNEGFEMSMFSILRAEKRR